MLGLRSSEFGVPISVPGGVVLVLWAFMWLGAPVRSACSQPAYSPAEALGPVPGPSMPTGGRVDKREERATEIRESVVWSATDGASPLLPVRGWVYDAFEYLTADGLLTPPWIYVLPLSRGEAAHLVRGLETREEVRARAGDVLVALRRVLSPPPVMRMGPWNTVLRFYGDVYLSSIGSTRVFEENVDAYEEFPFVQGSTGGLRLSAGVGGGRFISGVCVPRFLIRRDRGPVVSIERGYVSARFRGVGMLYGKARTSWGVGYRGDFVLADHVPPLPMLRVWGRRGTLAFDYVILGLKPGATRDAGHSGASVEHALFAGLRVLWWPSLRWGVEVGMGNVFPQGWWKEALQVWKEEEAITRVAALGVRLYPRAGIKVYGAVASDDLRGSDVLSALWRGERRTGALLGLYLSDPLGDRKTDFRIEWARLDEHGRGDWYGGGYSSGGVLLGHPMGRDDAKGPRRNERDLFVRARHRLFPSTTVVCEYTRGEAELGFEPFVVRPTPVWVEVQDYLSSVRFQVEQRIGERWIGVMDVRLFFTLKEVMQTGALWSHGSDQVYVVRVGYHVL